MQSSAAFDMYGNIHISIRRLIFALASFAIIGSAGMAVVNRASLDTYNAVARKVRTFNPSFMSPSTSATGFVGIQKGRVYAAKNPGLAQTPQGQSVYNDRRIIELAATGEGVTESEVQYVSPGNPSPMKTTAIEFIEWAGKDVTGSLPPASGNGTAGNGTNWRAWAGGMAEHALDAPVVSVPGAGQSDQFTAAANEATAPHTEGGEGGPATEVQTAPATAPTAESMANAIQAVQDSAQPTQNATATDTDESLRQRALQH